MTTRIYLPTSDSVHAAAYDSTTRVLTIWYRSSPREGYNYLGVPKGVFTDLLTSPNRGRVLVDIKRYVCVPIRTGRMDKPMHKTITVTDGKLLVPLTSKVDRSKLTTQNVGAVGVEVK
jgi:hypothetical protein